MSQSALEFSEELEKLLSRQFTPEEKEKIIKAYNLAEKSHDGQMRDSGEPFFEHPKEVAKILADFGMDVDTIAAGILHDVVEDCYVPVETIRDIFGPEVAKIVDGVTKISNLKLNERLNKKDMKSIEKIETIRKMLMAMSTDLRVIIVKLSDRLHNMRTLNFVQRQKQIVKSQETLKIYAPIADRLGIHKIKAELENLSFQYLYPDTYYELKQKIDSRLSNRQKSIDEYTQIIKSELEKNNIKAHVAGRAKHLYSIWEKMLRKGKSLDEIYDYIALRIITENQNQCYAALGIVHSIWPPMPGRIKDYIATPKSNGYKSLHTTVITNKGEHLEIQIRDEEMHEEAEYGLAAHWAYKQGVSTEKIKFLQNLMELHKDIAQNAFDINDIESSLESSEIFVFTPKGEIIHLPRGSTPIDFAYAIHTDVGNHFAGAKVNGKIVPISYKLQNGEILEIIINRNFQGPSIDWVKYSQSPRTKQKIKKYYRQKNESLLIEKGKDKFRELSKKLGFSLDDMLKKLQDEAFYLKYNIKNDDDLFVKIALEDVNINTIRNVFVSSDEKKSFTSKNIKKVAAPSVIIDGLEGVDYYLAKCCLPVPGDEIIGVISKRGIGIHRYSCKNIRGLNDEKIVKVKWSSEEVSNFIAVLSIDISDKTLMNIIRNKINIEKGYTEKFEITKQADILTTKLRIKVMNIEHLVRIINKLEETEGILSIRRI